MVHPEERQDLREALTKLVIGQMINDDFDSLYYERWKGSADRAVAAIAEFGYSLYSDIAPYRLIGRYAIKPQARRMADRCLQFLQTSKEYGWPPFPGLDWRSYMGSNSICGCLPVVI